MALNLENLPNDVDWRSVDIIGTSIVACTPSAVHMRLDNLYMSTAPDLPTGAELENVVFLYDTYIAASTRQNIYIAFINFETLSVTWHSTPREAPENQEWVHMSAYAGKILAVTESSVHLGSLNVDDDVIVWQVLQTPDGASNLNYCDIYTVYGSGIFSAIVSRTHGVVYTWTSSDLNLAPGGTFEAVNVGNGTIYSCAVSKEQFPKFFYAQRVADDRVEILDTISYVYVSSMTPNSVYICASSTFLAIAVPGMQPMGVYRTAFVSNHLQELTHLVPVADMWTDIAISGANIAVSGRSIYTHIAFGPLESPINYTNPTTGVNTFVTNGSRFYVLVEASVHTSDYWLFFENTSGTNQVILCTAYVTGADIYAASTSAKDIVGAQDMYTITPNVVNGIGVPEGQYMVFMIRSTADEYSAFIQIISPVPACVLGCTQIEMANGTMCQVRKLKCGDLIKGLHGLQKIKEVKKSPLQNVSDSELHVCKHIPKDYFAKGMPSSDLYISGGHALFLPPGVAKMHMSSVLESLKLTHNRHSAILTYEIVLPCTLPCENMSIEGICALVGASDMYWYHVLTEEGECMRINGIYAETLDEATATKYFPI